MLFLVWWMADGAQAQELRDALESQAYAGGANFYSRLEQAPLVADFDGDGLTDLLRPLPLSSGVLWSTGTGSFDMELVSYTIGSFGTDRDVWNPLAGDFTGDGTDDLLYVGTDQLWLHESGDFSPTFTWYNQSHPNGWRFTTTDLAVVGDFNGDGVDDVLRPRTSDAFLLIGRAWGTFEGVSSAYSPFATIDFRTGAVRAAAGDIDGDGSDELVAFGQGYISIVDYEDPVFRPKPTYVVPNGWLFQADENTPLLIGDMDGDGTEDIARFNEDTIYTFLSTGSSFDAFSYTLPNGGSFPDSAPRVAGDFNGDGLTDLARRHDSRTTLYLADGAGSWTEVAMPVGAMPSRSFVSAGDVDGNGTDDLLYAGIIEAGTQRFFVVVEPEVLVVQAAATALDTAVVDLQLVTPDGPLEGAAVRAHLEDASAVPVTPDATALTGAGGTASLSWSLGLNVPSGTYSVVVEVDPTEASLATATVVDLSVVPAQRSIAIASLLPTTYGDPPFILPVQAAAGAILEVQTSGDCTNSFDQIMATGAGFCTVTAAIDADPYYAAATADGFFSILPAPLTVTVDDSRRLYGGGADAPIVLTTGLVNSDTLNDLDGTLDIDAPPSDAPVGTYALTPSGLKSDDYDIEFVPGSLTVEPRPLVVSVTSSAVAYGAGPIAYELTYQGFADGESEASMETRPTVQHDAGARPDVGTYALRVTPGLAGNYTIVAVDGEAVVYPAPLLVDVADATVLVGEPIPEPVVTYLGFQYDDGPELFSPPPVVTVTAPDAPPPGAYERSVTGAKHPNYQTFYDDGLLLVVDDSADLPAAADASGCSSVPLHPFGLSPWLALLALRRRRFLQRG